MNRRFAQWNVLFMEYLKRDWKLILIWVIGLGGFIAGFVPAFVEIGKDQGLIGLYETMKNPAMVAMVGPTTVTEASAYTLGACYAHMMLVFCLVITMIIAGLHVVSHTRKEEEKGLTEFVCSYRVGRHAGSIALILEEILIHVIMALFIGGLMTAFGVESVDAESSFLFGISIGLSGIMAAVIALFVAQIMPTATGATGVSMGLIGLLYMVRACTDIYDAALSKFNPMGWLYLTFPFTENNWNYLVPAVLFCAVILVAAFLLERGRDMGSGYVRERTGRGKVSKSLLSVPGFLFRLNRGVIISWIMIFAILGGAYGSIYGEMQGFLEGNELLRMMFTYEGISLEESFTSVITVVLGGLAAILPILIVNKLFAEESSARFGQLFATKVSRGKLYWTTMVIATVSGAFSLLAAAGGLGGTAVTVMKEGSMEMRTFLEAGMNYFPAVLFMTALAAVVLGWIPRAGKALYVYLGYNILLNYVLKMLNLPEWFQKTAILSWIPKMPVDEFDGVVFAVICAVSVVLMIVGYVGYERRNLIEN